MNVKDNIVTGIICGLVAPLVVFSVYSGMKFPDETVIHVFHHVSSLGILSAVLSLCVFFNLAVFFLFIWTKSDRSAKGVLAATFFYAFIVVILKLT